jgi:hypothetical protein
MKKREGKSSVRFWTWAAIVSVPLCLLAIYWAMLYAQRGDYVCSAQYPYPWTLRLQPLPVMRSGWASVHESSNFFLAMPLKGFWALPAEGRPGGTFRPEQQPFYLRAEGPYSGTGWAKPILIEWFPTGSLKDLWGAFQHRQKSGMVAASRELTRLLPERATPKYWLIASLCQTGETKEARELLEHWRSDFLADPSYRGKLYLRLLENDLLAADPEQERLCAEYAESLGSSNSWQVNVSDYTSFQSKRSLIDDLAWRASQRDKQPPRRFSLSPDYGNFLARMNATKSACVASFAFLVLGEREEARDLLLGSYVIAEGTAEYLNPVEFMIAASSKQLLLPAMEDCYLRADWPADMLAAEREDLEAFFERLPARTLDEILLMFPAELQTTPAFRRSYGPTHLRWQAQERLLRAGLKAKVYFLKQGEWPEETGTASDKEEFADPFAKGRPLQRVQDPASGNLLLYSIGPDGADNKAARVYDPSNGIASAGDIILEIEREPRYHFPLEPGYQYAGMADFRARYPGDLPADTFVSSLAPGSNLKLKVAEDNGQLILWGRGPASEERSDDQLASSGFGHGPAVSYDPTNGINSEGLLFAVIPTR